MSRGPAPLAGRGAPRALRGRPPQSRPRRLAAVVALSAVSCSLACVFASAENPGDAAESRPPPVVYRWVDADGIPHYTTDRERVPANVRGQIQAAPEAGAGPRAPGDRWVAMDARPEVPGTELGTATSGEPDEDTSRRGPDAVATRRDAPRQPDPRVAQERAELDAQIAELEARISSDEETIRSFLSTPAGDDEPMLAEEPGFREIALRLPHMQRELRELRARRAALEGE